TQNDKYSPNEEYFLGKEDFLNDNSPYYNDFYDKDPNNKDLYKEDPYNEDLYDRDFYNEDLYDEDDFYDEDNQMN
ncbi:12244_t:CDS:1, partial [Dentiscutata erythropus]